MILNSSEAIFLPLIAALQTPGSPARSQATDTLIAIIPSQGIEAALDLATLILLSLLVAIFLAVLYVGLGLLRASRRAVAALEDYRLDMAPILDRGRAVAENVEFVSNVARRDFERLRAHLDGLAERLGEASDDMEDRIHEFNALLEVVQGEAEDLFIDAAATVRGVKTGARELGAGSTDRGDQVAAADEAVWDTPDS